jgi:hypothetical protein
MTSQFEDVMHAMAMCIMPPCSLVGEWTHVYEDHITLKTESYFSETFLPHARLHSDIT